MPRKADAPFSPPKTRQDVKSTNRKTILNRNSARSKRGIDLSDYRDNGAHRSRKWRALKKLRTREGWIAMSFEEQQSAEDEVVSKLEEEREAKKRQHERDWMLWKDQGVEGLVENEGGEQRIEDKDGEPKMDDEWETEEEGDEWETEEDNDEWEMELETAETEEEKKDRLGKEIKKIMDKSGARYTAKVQWLEIAAKKKYDELFS